MLTSVEKYEILGEIGCGGMATVYRARDRRLQRLVALKVMHPHLQGAQEARARFAREALTIARLRHPGLLEIFDYSGEDSEVCYIATELLTGPTVKQFIEVHPEIPAEMAACIALQVAFALAAAHAEGVIHRDVKPENVMFHEGRVKLTDFGIAQLVDVQGMTTTGQVLGSPGHMAPEQIEGRECTPRTDVFALGTVLYQLATGQPPFPGRNPHQILKAIIEGTYRQPVRLRPSVGARLDIIINRCLATDPAQRYVTAEALARDLEAFVAEGGIEDPAARLAAYLQDPEPFAKAFVAEVVARQTLLGEQAQANGKYPQALEHWNRVLAIDEGNPRVLAAVRRLGRRCRYRRMLAISSVATLCLGGASWVVQLTTAGEPNRLPPMAVSSPRKAATSSPSAEPVHKTTAELQPPPAPQGAGAPSAATVALTPAHRAPTDTLTAVAPAHEAGRAPRTPAVSSVDRRTPPGPSADTAKPLTAKRHRSRRPTQPRNPGPRTVIFNPTPVNVSISVDGTPARPFGPSFRQVVLSPGEHRFRFVGAHDCCLDQEFTKMVEPGDEPLIVDRKLDFRPAGLYVVTNTPANVIVDGGTITGRARSIIDVPHREALLEPHAVRVTAPGYTSHVRRVQLRAGEVRTIKVDLVQSGP